jgi:hypothetical protein
MYIIRNTTECSGPEPYLQNGTEWYRIVWNGTEWYGMDGMVWDSTEWYGMAQDGME